MRGRGEVSLFDFLGLAVTLTWFGLFARLALFDQVAKPAPFFAPLASPP